MPREWRVRSRGVSVAVRVPATDIGGCVRLTLWRSLLTAVAIALAVTDIPRTGLAFRIRDFYPNRVAPDTSEYWGPFEYHVAHLNESSDTRTIEASSSGTAVGALDLWPYKFDTLSIAPRAVAQLLDVGSYPPCVLYRESCTTSRLEPSTVFRMLDGLVAAVQFHWFAVPSRVAFPFLFIAKSNWVDRVNTYVFQFLTKNPEHRLHAVYHWQARRSNTSSRRFVPQLCGSGFAKASRPLVCDHQYLWTCDHPFTTTGVRQYPIWEHVAIRFKKLQIQYPDLELDLTVLVSSLLEKTHRDRNILPTLHFEIDTIEMTTLIRGRQCNANVSDCKTMFIDDYRYERSIVESDEEQWWFYVAGLRGMSQLYVWVRISFLVCGCNRAEGGELRNHGQRVIVGLANVARTILKIPGHTIVYGSWIPIIGYSLAYFFDSSAVQFVSEFKWSSLRGFFAFNPVEYVIAASVQMRNIWIFAMLTKLALRALSTLARSRQQRYIASIEGKIAFRGGWIGLVSWLTTFGLMRMLMFRDSNVVSIVPLLREMHVRVARASVMSGNFADKGMRLDLKCALASCIAIIIVAGFIKVMVRLLTDQDTSLFFCRSFYVPLSAGIIWSSSTLDTHWGLNMVPKPKKAHPMLGPSLHAFMKGWHRPSKMSTERAPTCCACSFEVSPIHWRAVQGCPIHEHVFDISRRTKEIWSMVRLVNIVNMSDPLVFVQIYVFGRHVFVYTVHSRCEGPYRLLLPALGTDRGYLVAHGGSTQLEHVINSREVCWDVLVNCG